jgi:16S rRNA (cytosine1402-N4)-methyltransferase
MQSSFKHVPVLLTECVQSLTSKSKTIDSSFTFIDATFGLGGYTRSILTTYPNSKVLAFDMDYSSVNGHVRNAASLITQEFGSNRFCISGTNFRTMKQFVRNECQLEYVDGIVFDLGVSSMQLDDGSRGFSFRQELDGPLDMRMGQVNNSVNSINASDVVNQFSEQEIFNIINDFGEEKFARKIARAIVFQREKAKIETTQQLSQIIRSAVPRGPQTKDPATRTFQAIRIFVNDELNSLRDALISSIQLLRPNGRLSVVSYHSLEDRITKKFIQHNSSRENPYFINLTKNPVVPSEEEIARNIRSRSAKLRIAERTSKLS